MVFVLLLFIFPAFIRAELLRIDQGTLNGTVLTSRNGNEFYAFYGIPYAQPPIGQLRFQPPKLPPPLWRRIRDASQIPPVCPQMNTWTKEGYLGSEDCLLLHVFTRNCEPETLAPVIVFIHGGGYSLGGGTQYDPEFFMDKPVVFVSINYRLGVFGFLSTGDSSFPGNYGLKDQVAALQWVQKNIRSFGGDPSTVTVMGHSAGASCVHLHTMSPSSKDLFHRAILQSGVATVSWSYSTIERAKQNFRKFLEHANCSRSSTSESVACLLALPAKTLKESEVAFRSTNPVTPFTPVIEPLKQEGAFFVTDPNEYAYTKPLKPLIVGFTSNEVLGFGTMHKNFFPAKLKDEDMYDVITKKLNYETLNNPELKKNITTLIKRIYYEDDLSNMNNELSTSLLLSDMKFKSGIVETIRTYSGAKYVYEYDYSDLPSSKGLGVGHNEELNRLFSIQSNREDNKSQRRVSEIMIAYWSNFVLSGDPNQPDKMLPTRWSPTRTDERKAEEYYMYISNNGFRMKKGLSSDLQDKLWAYIKKSQDPKFLQGEQRNWIRRVRKTII